MEVSYLWSDQVPEVDGEKIAVNDIAFSPDGTRVVAAVGNRVLLYRASDGELTDSLRGHKDTVYSVSFSNDGTRFASGGADNVVIIWKSSGQGLLKYNHVSSIQQVRYSPSVLLLASCSESDFGLWSPDQKQVTKEKVPSRILSAAWSTDGTLLALGMLSGLVSIRNQQAEEVLKIERNGPVWCLAFVPEAQGSRPAGGSGGPSILEHADNLAIGLWDRTYALYRLAGPKVAVVLSEKHLPYYPCSISCVNNTYMKSCYLIVTGSNKQVQIMSRDGTKLADALHKPADSWVWSNSAFGEENTVVFSTHSGAIHCAQLNYDNVNALFGDKFAYRENLTEVIIHHLVIDKKVRIKCKDMIHNLYLYKNKLAVQLFDKICIYECAADDNNLDMHFKLNKQRILLSSMGQNVQTRMVTNLLCVTSQHVLVAVGNVLELYGYDGTRQKIYTMDAKITCMKVDGGMDGREGVFLGLQSGDIFKVYVDNAFPIHICKRSGSVAKLDVNIYKTLMATVDADKTLTISDMTTQEVVYSLNNVSGVCFNTEVEDLLCITNLNHTVSIISGLLSKSSGSDLRLPLYKSNIDIIEQHISGTVLAYKGPKIFTTSKNVLTSTDIPQGIYISKALEAQNFSTAYKIACLGATENEWRILALKALRSNNLTIAKNAFAKLKDMKYLNLIETIQQQQALTSSTAPGPVAAAPPAAGAGTGGGAIGRRNRNAVGPTGAAAPAAPTAFAAVPTQLDQHFQAEILAFEEHYFEAAKIYMRAGKPQEAMRIFTDLKRFNDAKTFANSLPNAQNIISDLTAQQAKWLQETKDWKGAAELFCSMGQYSQAAHIIGENEGSNWPQSMMEVVRSCGVEEKDTLIYCGDKLSTLDDVSLAKEAYGKAQDYNKLMGLYVSKQLWNEAAKLADECTGKFDMSVFLSYAEWLVSQEQYMEAMDAFKKCQRGDLGRRLLMELTDNAVAECRFKDAGYFYWMLAKEVEQELSLLDSHLSSLGASVAGSSAGAAAINSTIAALDPQTLHVYMDRLMGVQAEYEHKADLYYAYSNIHSFVTDPFTSFQPEMLFQVSRFIINSLGVAEKVPLGISKTATLYTLSKQAMQLGAFKLARSAFERLQKLFIPSKFAEVELDMLLVQAKPIRDDPDHLPVCYRCGSTNPLLNPFNNKYAKGDVCTNCGHPFVRSFINFDILPLVEFVPVNAISDDEAIDLIRQNPAQRARRGGSNDSMVDGANVLTLDQDDYNTSRGDGLDGGGAGDLFTMCLTHTLEKQKNAYTPVQVDANTLLAMKRSDVFVCKPSAKNKRATFYKNMLPDISIAISQGCHRFFHLEDFEFAYLSEKKCPYSRMKNVGEYGSL